MKFDTRRFSVHMFYESKSLAWCLSYNEQLRKKGKMSKDQPFYPIDKFNNIFQNILDSKILDDVEFNPQVAAAIGGRLQSELISYCKVRHPR